MGPQYRGTNRERIDEGLIMQPGDTQPDSPAMHEPAVVQIEDPDGTPIEPMSR